MCCMNISLHRSIFPEEGREVDATRLVFRFSFSSSHVLSSSSSTFSIFHHMDAGSSKSDIIKAPSVTLLGDTSTCGQDSFQDTPRRRRHRCYAYLRRHQPYLSGLAIRLATLIVIVGVLIGLGLGLQYTEGMPRAEDFSHLTFDWQIDPRSFLSPFNTTFGPYNVLLDGHSHSTYSDGKMNVEQLLDWHLGK